MATVINGLTGIEIASVKFADASTQTTAGAPLANATLTTPTINSPTITSPAITNGTLTSPTMVTPVLGTPSSGTLSNCTVDGTNSVGFKKIPQVIATSYTLVASDSGKHISVSSGGVTIPTGIFSAGDAITIYNDSAFSQTISTGATLYLAGTATTGTRTLAQRGLCTVLCVASNTFVISGAGLT